MLHTAECLDFGTVQCVSQETLVIVNPASAGGATGRRVPALLAQIEARLGPVQIAKRRLTDQLEEFEEVGGERLELTFVVPNSSIEVRAEAQALLLLLPQTEEPYVQWLRKLSRIDR